MAEREAHEIKKLVRERYAQTARRSCGCGCQGGPEASVSSRLGYSDQELDSIPAEANLGLGCGNPTALASLRPGEVVLDLGSGAGIDCFLAAQRVGDSGRVIGVDMTADMIDRARDNAGKHGIGNVEFRLGEIEHLPVADGSVDVVISNCVINLSPDKQQVFAEVSRVLKPGGRMLVSDIVQRRPLPQSVVDSMEAYVGCIAGASLQEDYLAMIEAAGLSQVEVVSEVTFDAELPETSSPKLLVDGQPLDPADCGLSSSEARELAGSMASICVQAIK